jgi:hypothetical protein
VDPGAGLNDVQKKKLLALPGLQLRPLGRPARSQSQYRLRYSASQQILVCTRNSICCHIFSTMPLIIFIDHKHILI